jgi:hypothetical protein
MDLLHLPARFLAVPAAAVLDVEGDDRRQRADNLRAELTGPVDDELDLGVRHLARCVVWWLLSAMIFPLTVAVQVILNLRDAADGVVSTLAWSAVMFPMWMGMIHAGKALVAHYLLEGRWNSGSRLGRLAMVAQTPDVAFAITITTMLDAVVKR